jgi:hypothetical protein
MVLGQAGVLHLRMATSKPEQAPEQEGMLFKRTVELPPDTSLDALLSKWNPGMPPETLADLMTSVCRWNQLKGSGSARPGQKLLIPSVLPHGKDPEVRRPAAGAAQRAVPHAPPQVSPRVAAGQGVLEQRLRAQAAGRHGPEAPRQLWAMPGQAGQALAGANVKQQLQGSAWQHRPQQQLATKVRA